MVEPPEQLPWVGTHVIICGDITMSDASKLLAKNFSQFYFAKTQIKQNSWLLHAAYMAHRIGIRICSSRNANTELAALKTIGCMASLCFLLDFGCQSTQAMRDRPQVPIHGNLGRIGGDHTNRVQCFYESTSAFLHTRLFKSRLIRYKCQYFSAMSTNVCAVGMLSKN